MGIIWYVAAGSALGGALRYALDGAISRHSPNLPLGTLVINISDTIT